MEYYVGLPVLEFISNEIATMDSSDVCCERGHSWNWFNGNQVDACRRRTLASGSITVIMILQRLRAPTIRLFTGIVLLATWSQPPGAAQRSMQHRADSKKAYFLFNWMSLNAERARYPCSLENITINVLGIELDGPTYFASL
jgi:hypothetical protein